MAKGIIAALIVAVSILAPGVGCQMEPKQATGPEPRPAPSEERKAAPERKPFKAGDYIVYPLQWRTADETASRLYALLYPKYGPFLQIVPDPETNSLLIYLPPHRTRFQEMPGFWFYPY